MCVSEREKEVWMIVDRVLIENLYTGKLRRGVVSAAFRGGLITVIFFAPGCNDLCANIIIHLGNGLFAVFNLFSRSLAR